MFGLTCTSACKPREPAANTVRVNLADLQASAEGPEKHEVRGLAKQLEEDAADVQMKEREEARLKQEREARLRREEEIRLRDAEEARQREAAEEEARCRAAEAERLAQAEKARRQRRAAEEALAAEATAAAAAAVAERERLQNEEETKQRKALVAAFLKKHGFAEVNSSKRSLFGTSYPLHKAAENADDKIASMLLKEGAKLDQKNSSGRTAAEVALKSNHKGSHAKVLSVLTPLSGFPSRSGGA
eukprot:TRINITY_DN6732_c0_g1_i1.p1 TRINITY_DN6732_c0_g1~~TRINITY_DN6732_c0_g1_i1.p1  ORF type:complete len:245 (+),score=83.17 TRINITY_DN6732_c0_g1_i1:70-804(+)